MMAKNIGFTVEQINEMVELYNQGLSYAKIAERMGAKSPTTVMLHLKGKVQPRTTKQTARKYTANFDFFEVIDTEEKAYWLGFLFADGYISKKPSRLLGCSLHIQDKSHLEKFKQAIEATHPIREYENRYARIHLISDKLVDDVERHGLVEMKSTILKPPSNVPSHLIPHFIRGYFDGDGSWSKSPRGIGYKFTVTGTEEMLIWIAEQMSLVPRLYERHPDRDNNNFTLEAQAKGDMKKAIDYLYEGATVYLDRKYATAVKIRPLVQ